jgi:polyisoprenoid-binding protein YceI
MKAFVLKSACALAAATLMSAPAFASVKYNLDQTHLNVGFKIQHLVVSSVKGRFNKAEGSFTFDEKAGKVKSLDVTIDTGSVDTNNKDRDDHLRNPDFFDVTKPANKTIKFVAKEFVAKPGQEISVTGDLTIKGIKKPVTLKGKFIGKTKNPYTQKDKVGFELAGKINRKEFGLTWNKALETGGLVVGEDVELLIDGEADSI